MCRVLYSPVLGGHRDKSPGSFLEKFCRRRAKENGLSSLSFHKAVRSPRQKHDDLEM